MKLKLEIEQGIAILSVTESVGPQDVLVLKAGLTKLIQSGKKSILIDLTRALKPGPESVIQELASLPAWAQATDAQVIFASSLSQLGPSTTRDQALHSFNSSGAKLLSVEAKLVSQLTALQQKKTVAEQKLSGRAAEEGDLKTMRRENAELKKLVRTLEKQIRDLLKSRREPFLSPITQPQIDAAQRTIINVLKQEGTIPLVNV
jgi:hypothetical protein